MKQYLMRLLRYIGVYHPLQSFYRSCIFYTKRFFLRQRFRAYAGSGFTCNVCGHAYSKFKDDEPSPENAEAISRHKVIAGYGKNIVCPYCMSHARERLVLLVLEAQSGLTGKQVLHLSPERNVYPYLSQRARVTAADIQPGFYQRTAKNVEQQDATRFTYPDDTFDLIIANHVLEHIPDDTQAMSEIFRVLKPGGSAILQVPYSDEIPATLEQKDINNPKEQSRLFGQKDHVRIYSRGGYISRLQAARFEVRFISYEELQAWYGYAIQEQEGFFDIRKPII
ncbi:MAG TPA: methyltransferase domain-containing protein [Ferruginibacter sp.]|mgnify:CR=1 FL=1|nr:methyltransferase domain-containing protein [Ferruginibacter sp.]HRO06730.1 methyltransferase domain-containing protein [Ferruginibacter sp.]HRO96949.1 methyltransferase domain-containing protein [Ferruginibacter sp.]HRP50321.1 methyltransferase domain-containing protein [Ferruginibacter sp.]